MGSGDHDSTEKVVKGRAGHAHRRWRLPVKKVHADHVRADINVTPLVDVMLVLLIIFMLEALVMGRGQEVTLASARYVSTESDKLQPIVSIDVDKQQRVNMWVEKGLVGEISDCVGLVPDCDPNTIAADPKMKECCARLTVLGERVQQVWHKKPSGQGKIYIKAGQNVEYGAVAPVLVYLNRVLNLEQIDLAVAEKKE
jgi:biopolymer transport protein ExbD